MVHPRFGSNSFWNYGETCAVVGARYSAAPLGLITVAALLPNEWPIRLIDRNIEELGEEDLDWADLVMIGSMLPQQRDAKRIIALAHAHKKPVVIGGPDVTSSPAVYDEAEFRVLGEAEEIMAEFIAAWLAGAEQGVFAVQAFPNLATSPLPRFDLLKLEHYMHVGVQFSRGCPYNCEFCNVIELNGRVPRSKATEQMLAELDCLYDLGYRGHVDFVDDNFIGNARIIKPFLGKLGDWLERRGYPFEFSAEVSLNVADRDDLLELIQRAGFFAVFVGIETPDAEVLAQTRKTPNLLRDIAASVHKIYRAGIFANAGFIIGFDAEQGSVAKGMIDCIENTAIPVCMVGLLYALPNTQLSRRLLAERRLHADSDRVASDSVIDQCTSGLNYETLRPRRAILEDYRAVLQAIYTPEAFFGRVRRVGRELDVSKHKLRNPPQRIWRNLRAFARISLRMGIRDREVRGEYWRTLADCLFHNPRAARMVVSFAALYLHMKPLAKFMDARLEGQIMDARVAEQTPPDRMEARIAQSSLPLDACSREDEKSPEELEVTGAGARDQGAAMGVADRRATSGDGH
jgi:radical SAM superfamily enzyme YgiQ (UPF0313 family)